MMTFDAIYIFPMLAIGYVLLGLYTLYRRKDQAAVAFVVANVAMAGWSFAVFITDKNYFPEYVNLISQFQSVFGLMFVNGFYYFCFFYTSDGEPVKYRLNLLVFCSFLLAIFFSDFVTHASVVDGKVVYEDGLGYALMAVYLISLFIFMIYQMVSSYNKADQSKENNLYLLAGIAPFLCLTALFDLILPIFGIYDYLVFGYISAFVPSLVFAYAITKHDLLDIITSDFALNNPAYRDLNTILSFAQKIQSATDMRTIVREVRQALERVAPVKSLTFFLSKEMGASDETRKIERLVKYNLSKESYEEDNPYSPDKLTGQEIILPCKGTSGIQAILLIHTLYKNQKIDQRVLEFLGNHIAFVLYRIQTYNKSLANVERENSRKLSTLQVSYGQITHEISTPLLSVKFKALALQKQMDELAEKGLLSSEKIRTLPQQIADEVDRTNTVVQLLLMNLRNNKITSDDFSICSVVECVKSALNDFPYKGLGETDSVEFTIEKDFDFYGSDHLLIFVLFNLLKNAFHAIKAEGKGNISIYASSDEKGNYLHVRDTGYGIAAHHMPRIFEDFYSSKSSRTGTGLGLSFCKKAMESFKGSITCHSEEGVYTEFVLFFPPEKSSASEGSVAIENINH